MIIIHLNSLQGSSHISSIVITLDNMIPKLAERTQNGKMTLAKNIVVAASLSIQLKIAQNVKDRFQENIHPL